MLLVVMWCCFYLGYGLNLFFIEFKFFKINLCIGRLDLGLVELNIWCGFIFDFLYVINLVVSQFVFGLFIVYNFLNINSIFFFFYKYVRRNVKICFEIIKIKCNIIRYRRKKKIKVNFYNNQKFKFLKEIFISFFYYFL